MQFQVELRQLYNNNQGDWVELRKTIQMPFPPYQGLILGLFPDSDFNSNEDRVIKAMFLPSDNLFLARLEHESYDEVPFWREMKELLDAGWRYVLTNPFDTAADAQDSADDNELEYVVEANGNFYPVSTDVLRVLDMQGTTRRVVWRAAKEASS